MKRGSNVLEQNYLPLGESSDSDLQDRDSAVTEEGESDDEVKKRNTAVDREESYEEAKRP